MLLDCESSKLPSWVAGYEEAKSARVPQTHDTVASVDVGRVGTGGWGGGMGVEGWVGTEK